MEKKLYKIYDIQCKMYKGNGTIFGDIRQMVLELADYHDIDFETNEQGFENETMIQRIDRTMKDKTEKQKLEFLCEYGEWEVQELSKKDLIDDIITMDWYEIQNNDVPQEDVEEYRNQLEQLDIEVLQKYIDDEITTSELYDEFISKL